MWLKFSFFPDRPSLLAVVSSDGKVYFRAAGLGKFLGFSDTYSFARKYGTSNLSKIIPRDYLPSYWKKDRLHLVDFLEMIEIIRISGRLDENTTQQLIDLWCFGSVNELTPRHLLLKPRQAFALHVRPSGREKANLQDWIRKFIDEQLTGWKNSEEIQNRMKNSKRPRFDSARVLSPPSDEVSLPSAVENRFSSSSFDAARLSPSTSDDRLPQSSLEVNCHVIDDDLSRSAVDEIEPSNRVPEENEPAPFQDRMEAENVPVSSPNLAERNVPAPSSNLMEENDPIASPFRFASNHLAFQMKYETLDNLPDEIYIYSRGLMHVYGKMN